MQSTRNSYHQRFQNVIDYIFANLDQPLDLNQLAEVACMSPSHWHRIYRSIYGETLAMTVKRLRLHRAAEQILNTSEPLSKIALGAGYSSVQAFSRAFSQSYGLPPVRYKREGSHQQFAVTPSDMHVKTVGDMMMLEVNIKQVESFSVCGLPHRGSYMEIGKAFEKLFGWLAINHKLTSDIRSIGIYLDDPCSVEESELRSFAGATFDGSAESAFECQELVGGEYAVLHYKGPYSDMHNAYQWLYGVWLPQSGREAADKPVFEEYLNDPKEVAPTELLTDIYLPLK